MTYREIFYKNYYKTQASRYTEAPTEEDIAHLEWVLSNEILPHLPSDKNAEILELACGYGAFLGLLRKNNYTNVSGVDISEGQVEKAKQHGIDNIECADIASFLANTSKKYDVIIGIDIIEHFTKSELLVLLEAIKERLNPGGKVIFRTPNGDAPMASTFFFGDFTHEIYLNYFSAEQVMLAMGFDNIQISDSFIGIRNPLKNFFRQLVWFEVVLYGKLVLFASGRSSKKILFTPNLVITANK